MVMFSHPADFTPAGCTTNEVDLLFRKPEFDAVEYRASWLSIDSIPRTLGLGTKRKRKYGCLFCILPIMQISI